LRIIESILREDELERESEEDPNYGNSVLLQYLEFFGEQLEESMRKFLKDVHVLDRHHLKSLKEKEKLELHVEGDPYLKYGWPALLPRLFFKLVHMFGYPSLKVSIGYESSFRYLFEYKGHIIELRDHEGGIVFYHLTPYSVEQEDNVTPLKGAEEILKEFAENLLRIVMDVTPLHYGGTKILL